MRLLTRDFTLVEKILIVLLTVVLLGLAYYRFVDQPVKEQKAQALDEQAALQAELNSVNARLSRLQTWEQELAHTDKSVDRMPSYNSGNDEVNFLNSVLGDGSRMRFSASFGNASRTGNQIRRSFSLELESGSMESARDTLYLLTHSRFRCIIGNMTYQEIENAEQGRLVNVRTEGTFYETMIDGEPDLALDDMSPGTLNY